ncbi:MAG TPA: glutamate formimidoyltransferase [Gemmatimonadales bacterium]|nr:glutamate formimidoyltransferase [Gemmatimonadales bacterium]
MPPLLECVPNFSEGRDPDIIRRIAARIESVEGVTLLHVDPGRSTNRTVVTFAGEPAPVVEAAFRAIQEAAQLIDMRRHRGTHPRMGATDVCPLVPISGITLDEAAVWARQLAERVGRELAIPVYLYAAAQPNPARRDLAAIREGEYEGFAEKIKDPAWAPDYGPREFNPKTGATAIGAREVLVAFNVNLNTTSTRRANAVAFDVRESGRPKREGHPLTGRIVTDAQGQPVMIPGSLKAVKAMGWYIPEYGIAQVSMNLTDLKVTPLHVAFDEVCRRAEARGLRVTGSELVGLVPLAVLLEAGRHFLRKQQRSLGVSERELIRIAVRSLGLSELAPFDPEERILEYRLRRKEDRRLAGLSVAGFLDETASESPAPGGGSVAALVGALAASLGTMVANLSAHKRGWDERWAEFSHWAERGQALKDELLALVDEDTRAFNQVMAALSLPRGTAAEQAARRAALEAANRHATEVPFRVMQVALEVFELLHAMAQSGNPASISDAGVGALCARAAVRGAWLNVRTNLAALKDRAPLADLVAEGQRLLTLAEEREAAVLEVVERAVAAAPSP